MNTATVVGSAFLAIVAYRWLRCRRRRFNPKSIENQRILVTGASSGIGEQLAYQYAKLGARLVITARRESLLKEVAKKCQELGAKQIDAFPADMAQPEDRDNLIKFTQITLGGLDQLILNHANMRCKMWVGDADDDLDILHKDMEVNFMSFVDLASKALPMLKEVQGRIGVVSSAAGKIGSGYTSHYSTTKFAIQGFFGSLRQELLHQETGVSVTLCVLGLIGTDAAIKIMKSSFEDSGMLKHAASVVDTAAAIIKGVDSRVYEVYHPGLLSFILTYEHFFPERLAAQNRKYLPKNK